MAQTDAQTAKIGEYTFKVYKLNPYDAQDVLVDITKAIGPGLGAVIAGGSKVLDADVSSPEASAMVGSLVSGLSKESLRSVTEKMAGVTHCDGIPLNRVFEAVFRGDMPLMCEWLWFALKANFGNFTEWLGSALGGLKQKAAAQSPSTSKGPGQ